MKYKRMTVWLEPRQIRSIKKQAKADKVSASEVIRDMVNGTILFI